MPTYVEVAVNVPQIRGVFHYHLPPHLVGQVDIGHLVTVPFGKQTVHGVVLRLLETPAVPDTRPVTNVVDPEPVLTPAQLALAQYLQDSTLAPLAACISVMLPPGLMQMADSVYTLRDPKITRKELPGLSQTQQRLLALLSRRGPLRGRQIERAFPRQNWQSAANALIRRGLLTKHSVLPPTKVRPKKVRTAQLACHPQKAEAALPSLGRQGSQALLRRQRMLRYLLDEPGPVEVSWLYAESGGSLADLRVLAEKGLVLLGESEVWRDPLAEIAFVPSEAPQLTQDQQAVWQKIKAGFEQVAQGKTVKPFLLHGVTGSGKTEIYLHAVAETLQHGRQAIILVPEIALTPQTVRRFLARFPGQVGLMHSRLSVGERYDTWRRARTGDLSIIIGPRSALFSPLHRLGLIVVDEAHDDSYYQNTSLPFYHAQHVAVEYARLTTSICLLGSATPDVVARYRADRGAYQLLTLPSRILAHRKVVESQIQRLGRPSRYRPLEADAETTDLPLVRIVDMRQELKSGNRSIFSRHLQTAMAEALERDEQIILFLNRRGTATYVFCRDCGHSLRCPRCDLPLTFHRPKATLDCHHCGYQRQMPKNCPSCKSEHIRQYGTGTESVERQMQQLFPQVRTLRWDWETTRQKGAHQIILSHFAQHRADVLIGTQMLAKGLDLPLVTLVGVVLADVGLNLPDYRAAERTFQVLAQVAGRAGRSPLGGQVVLQTFDPENYVIQAAGSHDYARFYAQEIDYRAQLGYPPFGQLVRLEFRHVDRARAEEEAQTLARQIRRWIRAEDRRATSMLGPAPCFFSRIAGLYRWQIILRGPDPASLLRRHPLDNWRIEVNPVSLL